MRLYPKHNLVPLGVVAETSPNASNSRGILAFPDPFLPFPFENPLPLDSNFCFFRGLSAVGFGASLSGLVAAKGQGCNNDNTSED